MWIAVSIMSEQLFSYRNPGPARILFSRLALVLFLLTFFILGLVLSFSDVDSVGATGDVMLVWDSAMILTAGIMLVMPAVRLVRAISFPVIQKDDAPCVRYSAVMFGIVVALCIARGIWHLTIFADVNGAANSLNDDIYDRTVNARSLSRKVRVFWVFWELIAHAVFTTAVIAGVSILLVHDIDFDREPFYREETDPTPRVVHTKEKWGHF
jgi:hypothetical protein